MTIGDLPTFADLCARADGSPAGAAWGVFGDDDQIGTVNLLEPSRIVAGAAEVRLGQVHSLNWDIDQPAKNAYRRRPKRTHLGAGNTFGRDDFIDRFFLQYSSQWDGLRHILTMDERFYNGVTAAEVDDEDNDVLGVQAWSTRGIAGRGVLLDVARFLESQGRPIDCRTNFGIGVELLDATAAAQSVTVERGDVLLVRTGWMAWYLGLDEAGQVAASAPDCQQPGLAPGRDVAGWLWDHGVSACAADNMSLESYPLDEANPDSLHRLLIPGFGMPVGEYFWLDGLADACAADGRYTFLFTSAPLNVAGGVGSPPNALALR